MIEVGDLVSIPSWGDQTYWVVAVHQHRGTHDIYGVRRPATTTAVCECVNGPRRIRTRLNIDVKHLKSIFRPRSVNHENHYIPGT